MITVRAAQSPRLMKQPCPREAPVAVGGRARDSKAAAALFDREPRKKTQLDQFRLRAVFLLEPGQGFIECQEVVVGRGGGEIQLAELQPPGPSAALLPPLAPRAVDQDSAIASAAAVKKCPRVLEAGPGRPTSRRYAS